MALPVGQSLQDYWHAQKTLDAHRMARAKVADTMMAKHRALVSAHGYYGMPKPVLSQRRFANPSSGNQADIYSARPNQFGGALEGGVLRSAQGQTWAMNKLKARIDELNALDAGAMAMEGMPVAPALSEVSPEVAAPLGTLESLQLQIVGILNGLVSAVTDANLGSITYDNLTNLTRLLFRFAPVGDRIDLGDILAALSNMTNTLANYQNERIEDDEEVTAFSDEIGALLFKLTAYLNRMYAAAQSKTVPERQALSRALVKELGFANYATITKSAKWLEAARENAVTGRRRGMPIGKSPFIGTGRAAAAEMPYVPPSQLDSYVPGDVTFTKQAMTREDSEQAGNVARFDAAPRQAFAKRSGAFYGESLPMPGEVGAQLVKNPTRSLKKAQMPTAAAKQVAPTLAVSEITGSGSSGLTRASLPKTREGFEALAAELRGKGQNVRINKNSQLKNIRANFIRKFKL
jgi:hypothetical protein